MEMKEYKNYKKVNAMGELYEIKKIINEEIKRRNLDEYYVKGTIGMKSGILIAAIESDTPDNKEKTKKLKDAVKEVLNINIENKMEEKV